MAAPKAEKAGAGAKGGKGGFDVLDGRRIRELVQSEAELREHLEGAFRELDKDNSGALSRSELRPAFAKLAAVLGLPPPGSVQQLDRLLDLVFSRQAEALQGQGGQDLSLPQFLEVMQGILSDVAAMLEEDPLFLAVFNGVVLTELAANEEALAQVISKAFDSMDKDKSGKLSRSELLPVLKLLSGGEEGLPPPQVIEAMEEAVLAQFGQGGEELNREEFAVLFKELVLFMAAALDDSPVVVVQDATVLNGYALKKLVADEAAFKREADDLFKQWDRSKQGKLSKADVGDGLKRLGLAIGLPPIEAKEAEAIYSELFSAADFDGSGFVDRAEFGLLLKALLLSLADQLAQNPVVVEASVAKLLPGSQLNDGTNLFEILNDDEKLTAVLNERFDALDVNKNGTLSKCELKPAFIRLAQLLGLPPPGTQEQLDRVLDEMFRSLVSEDFSEEVDREAFSNISKQILREIANSLEANPALSVSLDGSQVRAVLDDSKEFEEQANSLFEALDTDKSGQLSLEELRPAIQELGVALGIPPAGVREEGDAIVAAAVAEYGHGKKELSREEFGNLLKDILADIAVRLASTPIVVGVQSVQVLNGGRIRRLLANDEEFKVFAEELFTDWDLSGTGRLSRSDLIQGMRRLGMSLGLPPPKAKDAERVYSNLFIQADMDDSGFVDKKEFLDFIRTVFVQVSSELEKNPVILETQVLSYSA